LKIQIVIPLWKRPDVTTFCFDHLLKLIEASKHDIRVLCVISESEYIKVCDDYGFQWIYAENFPVGSKINQGIKRALNYDWDYLMMMNSDNVIKNELLEKYYQPFFEKGEKFFGVNKVTYVNFGTTDAREIKYDFSILGIGKCIRRDVVEQSFKSIGKLYEEQLNKCLDDTMMDNIMKVKIDGKNVLPVTVKYDGMLAMDFKSEVNIWPWEKFKDRGTKVCYNPESEEASLIKQ
jgi:hypothetical protein